MARIPYPDLSSPELAEHVAYARAERGGRLSNLFAMQMHSPEVMQAWIDLGSAIRYRMSLEAWARELAICAVARRIGYDFQWHAHAPIAVESGVSPDALASLPDWRSSTQFSAKEQVVLEYVDTVTDSAEVSDALFDRVSWYFAPRDIVELTATIGFYGLGARFLKTLQIGVDDDPLATADQRRRPS